MKAWTEMTELEQLWCTYSDAYKDAHGFRPRGELEDWSVEHLTAEIQRLSEVIEQQIAAERLEQEASIEAFEEHIREQADVGIDRAQAIANLHVDRNTWGDNEFLCYDLGLPYGYIK